MKLTIKLCEECRQSRASKDIRAIRRKGEYVNTGVYLGQCNLCEATMPVTVYEKELQGTNLQNMRSRKYYNG